MVRGLAAFLVYLADWLGERLRDLSQWPINLVRDLPARAGRIAGELWHGLWGAGRQALALKDPAQRDDSRPHLLHPLLAWIQRMIMALFDLIGGPEICQFAMHLMMPTTPLSAAEIGAAASVLGDAALRWHDVRVAEGGLLRLIFKHNGGRAFATWHTVHMPHQGSHSRGNHALLVHELTHVYQYERLGSRYLTEAIYVQARMGSACYHYGGRSGLADACREERAYDTYNREAQAQIAQDYYSRRQQGDDVSMYEPFIAQLQSAKF